MNVEIRLFATFREYLPPGSDMFSFSRHLDKPATVGEIMHDLKLPDDIPKIIIVNGIHATPENVLAEGDVLSIFPPVAGG
jgi:sulfur-carrier protein